MSDLTPVQQAYVQQVPPWCRDDMTKYLSAGAEVVVVPQRQVAEAPAFAIEVADTDFWIGCCSTAEEAGTLATELGLRVHRKARP